MILRNISHYTHSAIAFEALSLSSFLTPVKGDTVAYSCFLFNFVVNISPIVLANHSCCQHF